MPETNAARSYAYMSRNHPKDFLTFSGCSVRATNSAHFGATFRKSSAVITVGEFPVRGIIPLDLSPYSSEKCERMVGWLTLMYVNSKPYAWPGGSKMDSGGDFTMT